MSFPKLAEPDQPGMRRRARSRRYCALMSPTARIATALIGGLVLGVALSTAATQFDWGNNTVGISTIVAGLAVGLLFASTVDRRRDER